MTPAIRRWLPRAVVALVSAVNLAVTAAELSPARNLNDSALHLSMIRWAVGRMRAGHLPFDGWYPYLSLGSPQFHHYQTLPHIAAAVVALVLGVETVYHWSLWLMLGLWPVSVYLGARWLGLSPVAAAAAAVASPVLTSVPGYGFEHASYTWRGLGMWTQLWAMWLMPLVLGSTWRAISTGRWVVRAALLLAALICCHFLTGYLALLLLPLFALLAPGTRRLARTAAVGFGGLAASAWAIVPLALDSRWSGNLEYYVGTTWFDSYGPRQVIDWLVHGNLTDAGHLPVISGLALAGLMVAAIRVRRDPAMRPVLALLAVSLLLFAGRSVVGPVINLLPGGTDLPLHRYISGVQLAALLLAGLAAEGFLRVAVRAGTLAARRVGQAPVRGVAVGAAVAVAALAVAILPAYQQVANYDAEGGQMIAVQQSADATDGRALDTLVARARAAGDGRLYAGTKGATGRSFTVGQVPLYSEFENLDADGIGMWLNTESLSSDVETRFNEADPGAYDLFNVRYVVTDASAGPPVKATLVETQGRFALWRVSTPGYVSLEDSEGPPIVADRTDIGRATSAFVANPSPKVYPPLQLGGEAAPTASLDSGPPPASAPGSVDAQSARLTDGVFSATVDAARPATVILHATYDPRWRVEVDGVAVPAGAFAPSFVGRTIPAGRHTVVFSYQPVGSYPWLWAFGLLAILLLARREGVLAAVQERWPGGGARPLARPTAAKSPGSLLSAIGRGWSRATSRISVGVAVFGAALGLYLLSAPGHLQTVDIRAEFAVAESIVGKGDFTVNPNLQYVTVPSEPGIDGRRYSHHGLGQSLLLIPAAVVARVAGCPPDPGLCPPGAQLAGEWAASFVDPVLAALTILVFFGFARDLGYETRGAALGAGALALGTAEWAYAHDTFDVAATGLFLLLALRLLLRGGRDRSLLALAAAGLCAGFTVLLRLPSLLLLPVLGLLLLSQVWRWPRRRAMVAVVSWGGAVVVSLAVLAWYNWVRFGSPTESGYGLATDTYPFSTPLLTGLAGQLLSPGKSIFLFSPALALAVLGAAKFTRRHLPLAASVGAVLVISLCFYGSYQEWAGDWAWGPRYLVPLLPPLMLFALPALTPSALASAARRVAAAALVGVGAVVQLLDVLVDYQHQIQLKFDDGISLHSYWSVADSAIWRHGEALLQMVAGNARYPVEYRFTDASLGLPLATVPDTWWSYAWLNPDLRPHAALALLVLLALLGTMARRALQLDMGPAGAAER